jgi:sugar phosphate isomerase/epimerase
MKLGAYTACLHDKPVAEALQVLRDLGLFSSAGITLTALNCNGNPLDPNPRGRPQARPGHPRRDRAGALLGVRRVVTMSGLPASDPGGRFPSWTVLPWHSVYLDARDYQWNEVGIPLLEGHPGPRPRCRRQGLHRDAPFLLSEQE